MAESFGGLLRNCREHADLSIGELAKRINYSKSHISKIENGHKQPTEMFARQCDRVLGADGALTSAAPAREHAVQPGRTGDVWVLELEQDGGLRFAELPRRQVLAGAGALLGYAVTRGSRPTVDEQTIAVLRASFDHFRLLGTMTSPAVVLGSVIAQVHTLRGLAADNPEPVRADLLLLAARVAEYVGWMSQEVGREIDALRWTDRAVDLAAGQDPHFQSFAAFRQAEIALYQHNPHRTIELARHAQEDRAASARQRGLAARCEAQGHALAGDVRGFEVAMERAATLLAVREPSNGPVLGSSVPDEVGLVRGWGLYDLGDPGAAADLLDRHLGAIPPAARRARARFGVRRALAHAQHGDLDQACVTAREVLADVAQVDSATIRLDLAELSRTLGRWHTHRDARELRHEVVALLGTRG